MRATDANTNTLETSSGGGSTSGKTTAGTTKRTVKTVKMVKKTKRPLVKRKPASSVPSSSSNAEDQEYLARTLALTSRRRHLKKPASSPEQKERKMKRKVVKRPTRLSQGTDARKSQHSSGVSVRRSRVSLLSSTADPLGDRAVSTAPRPTVRVRVFPSLLLLFSH